MKTYPREFAKTLVAFAIIFSSVLNSNAQSFVKGQKDLDIGLGLGNNFYSYYGNRTSALPAIGLSFDYGITDDISLGGYLGFAGATWTYSGTDYCNHGVGNGGWYNYTDTYKWTFTIIGVRGAYHFAKLIPNDKIDLYAGLMLGDDFAHESYSTTAPCSDHVAFYTSTLGGFAWSGFLGCRYRFNDHAGIFGELGYGISYLTIGFNYKF
jgi:hypothetical protein